jgi:hypothetical protein
LLALVPGRGGEGLHLASAAYRIALVVISETFLSFKIIYSGEHVAINMPGK